MNGDLKTGDLVVVIDYYGSPIYQGTVIGVTKRSAIVNKKTFFGDKMCLEKIENVHKIIA